MQETYDIPKNHKNYNLLSLCILGAFAGAVSSLPFLFSDHVPYLAYELWFPGLVFGLFLLIVIGGELEQKEQQRSANRQKKILVLRSTLAYLLAMIITLIGKYLVAFLIFFLALFAFSLGFDDHVAEFIFLIIPVLILGVCASVFGVTLLVSSLRSVGVGVDKRRALILAVIAGLIITGLFFLGEKLLLKNNHVLPTLYTLGFSEDAYSKGYGIVFGESGDELSTPIPGIVYALIFFAWQTIMLPGLLVGRKKLKTQSVEGETITPQ